MATWTSTGITIISAVLSSSLVLSGLGFIYAQIYSKPDVQIKIIANDIDKRMSLIKVTNNGRMPATNLTLKVISPASIINYTTFSSNLRTITNKLNSNLLEIYTPKFVEGEGSLIKVVMLINATPITNYLDYIAYATYDQGSVIAIPLQPLLIEESINSFMKVWSLPLILIIIGLDTAILIFIVIPYRKKSREKYLNKYKKIINATYKALSTDKILCLKQLEEIEVKIKILFRKRKINDSQYEVLKDEILESKRNIGV
jgi:hypothetical protein